MTTVFEKPTTSIFDIAKANELPRFMYSNMLSYNAIFIDFSSSPEVITPMVVDLMYRLENSDKKFVIYFTSETKLLTNDLSRYGINTDMKYTVHSEISLERFLQRHFLDMFSTPIVALNGRIGSIIDSMTAEVINAMDVFKNVNTDGNKLKLLTSLTTNKYDCNENILEMAIPLSTEGVECQPTVNILTIGFTSSREKLIENFTKIVDSLSSATITQINIFPQLFADDNFGNNLEETEVTSHNGKTKYPVKKYNYLKFAMLLSASQKMQGETSSTVFYAPSQEKEFDMYNKLILARRSFVGNAESDFNLREIVSASSLFSSVLFNTVNNVITEDFNSPIKWYLYVTGTATPTVEYLAIEKIRPLFYEINQLLDTSTATWVNFDAMAEKLNEAYFESEAVQERVKQRLTYLITEKMKHEHLPPLLQASGVLDETGNLEKEFATTLTKTIYRGLLSDILYKLTRATFKPKYEVCKPLYEDAVSRIIFLTQVSPIYNTMFEENSDRSINPLLTTMESLFNVTKLRRETNTFNVDTQGYVLFVATVLIELFEELVE